MLPTASNNRLRSGAMWVIAWRVIGFGSTAAANIIFARWLGPEEFGTYLFITSVMAFGCILACAGLNETSLRSLSELLAVGKRPEAIACLRRVLQLAFGTTLAAAMAVAVLLAIWQARKVTTTLSIGTLLVVALGVVALGWIQIIAESLRGLHELRFASLFSGGQAGGPLSVLLALGAFLAVATFAPVSASTAITLGVFAAIFALILAIFALRLTLAEKGLAVETAIKDFPSRLAAPSHRRLLALGGTLMAIQLLSFIAQQFDLWVGEFMLGSEQLGLYGVAKRSMLLAAMPVQMAMLTIIASIPELHAQNRRAELERLLRNTALLAAVPALLALGALVLFPKLILGLIFGGNYDEATGPLLILALGHLTLILSGNPVHVLTMTGRERTAVIVNFLSALVLVIGAPLAAYFFGIHGLAAASAAGLAFQSVVLWWLARQQVGVWTHVGFPRRGREI
jgi:O-antigen/teichoic acid export membrane protein